MSRFSRNVMCFILFGIIMTLAQDADAYIDPGTGSYLLQILIASVVSGLFVIKIWWARIKSFLYKKKPEKNNEKHGM